jgi:hypothetical protein
MLFRKHPVISSMIRTTYNAISLDRGSWSCSSGLKGVSEGRDGAKAVTVLAGSIWSAEVGDMLSSGTAFS